MLQDLRGLHPQATPTLYLRARCEVVCFQPVALHDGVPRILCLYGARLHKIRRLPGGIDAQHGECRSWLDCLYLPSTKLVSKSDFGERCEL